MNTGQLHKAFSISACFLLLLVVWPFHIVMESALVVFHTQTPTGALLPRKPPFGFHVFFVTRDTLSLTPYSFIMCLIIIKNEYTIMVKCERIILCNHKEKLNRFMCSLGALERYYI